MRPFSLPPTLLVLLMSVSLSACALNPFGRGGDEEAVATAAAAEEELEEDDGRIPVLALEQELEPNPRFYGQTLAIPPAFANAAWSQPGGEGDHAMHHLSAPETLTRAWQAKIGVGGKRRAPLTAPPIVAERKAFTLDAEARVTAFDTSDGTELWQTALTPDVRQDTGRRFFRYKKPNASEIGFGGGVAFDDGLVFMATGFGFAAALDADSGEKVWQVDLPAPVRNPPTAVNGKLFLLTISNQIVCLDQNSGETLWTYESFEETARFLASGSPAVDGDVVIAPFSSGEVVALDGATGRLLWTATVARSSRFNALSNLNDIAGSPVIDRGAVFAVSHSGQFGAIDGRTGRVVWEIGLAGLHMPWISGDYIFVVSVEGDLIALARQDGAVVWRRELPAYENPKKQKKPITWAGPLLAGENLILVSSSGEMLQVSPQDGETVSTYKLGSGTVIPPIVADGTVYVINDKGRLEAWR